MSILRNKTFRVAVAIAAVAGAITGAVFLHRAYYLRDVGVVVPGKLYRCRQPRGWQWQALQRHRITKVINLRPRAEEPGIFDEQIRVLREEGVEFVNIPVPTPLPTEQQYIQFIREVRSAPGAVLFHCAHGRNRTGFMAAAYMIVMHGWTVEKAMADLESYNPEFESTESVLKRRQLVQTLTQMANNRQGWRVKTAPAAGGGATTPTTAPATAPATRGT